MIKVIDITPYPRQLFLVKDEQPEKVYKRFGRSDGTFDIAGIENAYLVVWDYIYDKTNNKAGYLVYFYTDNPVDKYLVHEASHVTLDLFRDIQDDISFTCQEPFAYLIEFIFNELQIFAKQ